MINRKGRAELGKKFSEIPSNFPHRVIESYAQLSNFLLTKVKCKTRAESRKALHLNTSV